MFRFLADYRMIFYGLILIVMMLFRQEGILGNRTYPLRLVPPWEKIDSGPQYQRRDKFLPDEDEKRNGSSRN
jgi:hypothetical protein